MKLFSARVRRSRQWPRRHGCRPAPVCCFGTAGTAGLWLQQLSGVLAPCESAALQHPSDSHSTLGAVRRAHGRRVSKRASTERGFTEGRVMPVCLNTSDYCTCLSCSLLPKVKPSGFTFSSKPLLLVTVRSLFHQTTLRNLGLARLHSLHLAFFLGQCEC